MHNAPGIPAPRAIPFFARSNFGFDASSRPPAAIQMGLSPPPDLWGDVSGIPHVPGATGEPSPARVQGRFQQPWLEEKRWL